jgi:phage recombination protein Bet
MTMTATNVVPISATNIWSGAQLSLIKNTVAADCNPQEFDLFVTVARNAGLDPFRKQISALVFNKNKPDKRRMAIVTTIDGLRVIAARSRRYRPDEDEPEFIADPAMKAETNPLGLEKALVRIWIADDMREGGWKRVTGVAYWDEFAPVSDEWKEGDDGRRRPTGKKTLDTGGNWGRMPRLMLAKCAEAQALRKAFPEDLSALYERAELDQAIVGDMLPSEQVESAAVQDRLARIGGGSGIMIQFYPNEAMESIPLGQVADRIVAAARDFTSTKHHDWFVGVNRAPLQDFWARAPGDALAVKKALEAIRVDLLKAEAETADA